jgi:Zn ribbon nucleic-acid-binding protein
MTTFFKTGDACPKCGRTDAHIMVEYGYDSPERYDGISEVTCQACGYREGRWTGKELKEGYIEPRFGHGGKPIKI